MPHLPPIRLTGATILREGELRQRSVAIARGRITRGPLPAAIVEAISYKDPLAPYMAGQ